MPTLRIDFQEGFSGKAAVLKINGSEVYRGTPRTRTQIGLAESRSFDLPAQKIKLEFEAPESGLSGDLAVDLAQDHYIGVSLGDSGEVSFKTSLEPFGYL